MYLNMKEECTVSYFVHYMQKYYAVYESRKLIRGLDVVMYCIPEEMRADQKKLYPNASWKTFIETNKDVKKLILEFNDGKV